LRRAVDVFGFHLTSIDLRQNSDVHERVINELFAMVGASADYRALGEDDRVALLLERIPSGKNREGIPKDPEL
jgi:phosphoenolpyruvate carboxylase